MQRVAWAGAAVLLLTATVTATPLAPWLMRPARALVERFSGLRFGRHVPVVSMTEEEARAYLRADLAKDAAGQDLEGQSEILFRLGFLPSRVDLHAAVLELVSSQAAAFYDPATGVFHNISRFGPADALGEPVVVAHELTHALQDQVRPLKPLFDARKDNDDASTALRWSTEGHATVLGNRAGNVVWPVPGPAGLAAGEGTTFAGWTPLYRRLALLATTMTTTGAAPPAFLTESLLAPYLEGSRAFWAVEAILGRRAHLLWLCHPARSTEELVHVEKYLAGTDPPLAVPLPVPAGARPRTQLVLGEWALRWLLRQGPAAERADEAAAGWGGDTAVLLGDGRLVWRIRMDSADDALELAEPLAGSVPHGVSVQRMARDVIAWTGGSVDPADLVAAAPVTPAPGEWTPSAGACRSLPGPTPLPTGERVR